MRWLHCSTFVQISVSKNTGGLFTCIINFYKRSRRGAYFVFWIVDSCKVRTYWQWLESVRVCRQWIFTSTCLRLNSRFNNAWSERSMGVCKMESCCMLWNEKTAACWGGVCVCVCALNRKKNCALKWRSSGSHYVFNLSLFCLRRVCLYRFAHQSVNRNVLKFTCKCSVVLFT